MPLNKLRNIGIAAHIDAKAINEIHEKIFKVGIQFLNLSRAIDEQLSRDITGEARAQEILKKFR